MVELARQEDIQHFLSSNGLDKDFLDERSESLEVYRQTGEFIADFFRSIERRFTSIEYRLNRLEKRAVGTSEGMNCR